MNPGSIQVHQAAGVPAMSPTVRAAAAGFAPAPLSTTLVVGKSRCRRRIKRRVCYGACLSGSWIPIDLWERIAAAVELIVDLQAFQSTCRAAMLAVERSQRQRRLRVCKQFDLRTFSLPDGILDKVLMVHVVPPTGESLIMFLDESQDGRGVELAWLKHGRMLRTHLGLPNVSASTVSNVRFAPGGESIALLATLETGVVSPEAGEQDPLHRLRGWEEDRGLTNRSHELHFSPCDDCTVQVVDLIRAPDGEPEKLELHTFTHVFVPEYGFDMVWRTPKENGRPMPELAFTAMLHSMTGAATYLVRWKRFRTPTATDYVFMACIDGASRELMDDKRRAMANFHKTRCTARVELSQNGNCIFFDTVSKFGILRFDQIQNPSTSIVVRADLPNSPLPSPALDPYLEDDTLSATEYSSVFGCGNSSATDANGQVAAGINPVLPIPLRPCGFGDIPRVTRMSPDGALLCSVVGGRPNSGIQVTSPIHAKYIEMRSSTTGNLLFRRLIVRGCSFSKDEVLAHCKFEKSGEIAQYTLGFSTDSSLIWVRDIQLSCHSCVVSQRLPYIIDARSGRLVQEFSLAQRQTRYEQLQVSPDALTIYATRFTRGCVMMDALDVLSGRKIKTVALTGPVLTPERFSPHAVFLLPNRELRTVSRGDVDVLWETTRGSLGCGWKAIFHGAF